MSYINQIGVELEGGWNYGPPTHIHGDRSVQIEGCKLLGEISSPPLYPDEVEEFLIANYPSITNDTCGFHVHVSLKENRHYSLLMSSEFYELFLKSIEDWANKEQLSPDHPFWARFRGDNIYCKKEFNPSKQLFLQSREELRRTHLNYCYTLHKTIECRLFPGFMDYKLALRAVNAFTECIDTFLEESLLNEHTEPKSETIIISEEEANNFIEEIPDLREEDARAVDEAINQASFRRRPVNPARSFAAADYTYASINLNSTPTT